MHPHVYTVKYLLKERRVQQTKKIQHSLVVDVYLSINTYCIGKNTPTALLYVLYQRVGVPKTVEFGMSSVEMRSSFLL